MSAVDSRAGEKAEARVPRYTLLAAVLALYALGMYRLGKLGWQHIGLLVLFWSCLAPSQGMRRFVRDWWPMVLFWLSYDAMRAFSSSLFHRVSVEPPYRWEAALFLSPAGVIWPFYFARWTAEPVLPFWLRALGAYCNLIYLTQLVGIPLVLFWLWVRGEIPLFRRMIWSLTALHVLALCIYLAYPAAPPWWVYENGFLRPTAEHSMPTGFAKGSALSGLFEISPNRFAAIPSLHAAYPLLLTLVLSVHGSRARWLALAGFYAGSMWFACVFLNQHYIVDLLIGAVLVLVALPVAAMLPER